MASLRLCEPFRNTPSAVTMRVRDTERERERGERERERGGEELFKRKCIHKATAEHRETTCNLFLILN